MLFEFNQTVISKIVEADKPTTQFLYQVKPVCEIHVYIRRALKIYSMHNIKKKLDDANKNNTNHERVNL